MIDQTSMQALFAAVATLYPSFGPYVGAAVTILTAVVTIASAIGTFLPVPQTTSGFYYFIYNIIVKVSGGFGKAKSLLHPENAGIVAGPQSATTTALPSASPEPIKPVIVPPAK